MNYKILVTEENREAIKDIADRNGMNKHNFKFNSPNPMYYIKGDFFAFSPILEEDKLNFKEVHFNQFKEMFDNKMETKELETWLKETKAKNLNLHELVGYIASDISCSRYIYSQLEKLTNGNNGKDCAKYLFNQWQKEKEQPIEFKEEYLGEIVPPNKVTIVESEFSPKRGDRVLVWNSNDSGAIERNYFDKTDKSILALDRQEYQDFLDNKDFVLEQYEHMKPLPTKPDFKSSELLYTEKDMIEYSSYSLKLALEIIETRKVPLILSPEQWKKEEKQL